MRWLDKCTMKLWCRCSAVHIQLTQSQNSINLNFKWHRKGRHFKIKTLYSFGLMKKKFSWHDDDDDNHFSQSWKWISILTSAAGSIQQSCSKVKFKIIKINYSAWRSGFGVQSILHNGTTVLRWVKNVRLHWRWQIDTIVHGENPIMQLAWKSKFCRRHIGDAQCAKKVINCRRKKRNAEVIWHHSRWLLDKCAW